MPVLLFGSDGLSGDLSSSVGVSSGISRYLSYEEFEFGDLPKSKSLSLFAIMCSCLSFLVELVVGVVVVSVLLWVSPFLQIVDLNGSSAVCRQDIPRGLGVLEPAYSLASPLPLNGVAVL